MATKLKTSDVEKSLYVNYLERAEQCMRAAENSFSKQDWTAATINAIHSCISACDAMCVYFLGRRYAGEDHANAVTLFRTINPTNEEANTNTNRFIRTIRIKNMAEYEERLVFKSEAARALKDCERFLAYVKKKVP